MSDERHAGVEIVDIDHRDHRRLLPEGRDKHDLQELASRSQNRHMAEVRSIKLSCGRDKRLWSIM